MRRARRGRRAVGAGVRAGAAGAARACFNWYSTIAVLYAVSDGSASPIVGSVVPSPLSLSARASSIRCLSFSSVASNFSGACSPPRRYSVIAALC